MKRTNICIKCNSREISLVKGSKWEQNKTIPVDWALKLPLDRFICLDCGYTEEYVRIEELSSSKINRLSRLDNTDYSSDVVDDDFV